MHALLEDIRHGRGAGPISRGLGVRVWGGGGGALRLQIRLFGPKLVEAA